MARVRAAWIVASPHIGCADDGPTLIWLEGRPLPAAKTAALVDASGSGEGALVEAAAPGLALALALVPGAGAGVPSTKPVGPGGGRIVVGTPGGGRGGCFQAGHERRTCEEGLGCLDVSGPTLCGGFSRRAKGLRTESRQKVAHADADDGLTPHLCERGRWGRVLGERGEGEGGTPTRGRWAHKGSGGPR